MYADDTVIYVSGPDVEVIKDHLQEDIYCIEEWMNQNRAARIIAKCDSSADAFDILNWTYLLWHVI